MFYTYACSKTTQVIVSKNGYIIQCNETTSAIVVSLKNVPLAASMVFRDNKTNTDGSLTCVINTITKFIPVKLETEILISYEISRMIDHTLSLQNTCKQHVYRNDTTKLQPNKKMKIDIPQKTVE